MKIEIKEQTSEKRFSRGESYTAERAIVQIGEDHVLKILCIDGVWLHYEIESQSSGPKPSNIERFFLDLFFQRHSKEQGARSTEHGAKK